jgi:capsular exopolysaccharide synthesis family protein
MAKTYEAIVKTEKEQKMNFLQPIRKPETALAPLPLIKDLAESSPDWCKELKTRLHTNYHDADIKTILFTGTKRESGCSNTAAGFALSLAKTFQNRVLLVDVNLRKPGIHKFFENYKTHGLFDLFLQQRMRIDHHAERNLYVVTCNQNLTDEIDGFFGSDRFEEFLEKMRKRFDYVILDGPPVTSSPESRIIGTKVDGVILMLESGKTRRQVALKAKKEIEEAGGKLLGVVLNKRKYYIPQWVYNRL